MSTNNDVNKLAANDVKRLARLEGFQAGVVAIVEAVTGRKPVVGSGVIPRRRGRPNGARNKPKPVASVSITSGTRKPSHRAA